MTWGTADAEALPFADGDFDVVLSAIGIMFAPHHQQAADELVRVCRPGGTIGVLSWTPEGFIGQVFAVMKPYAPPPPHGASPAPLWGRADHVRSLFGDRVTDLHLWQVGPGHRAAVVALVTEHPEAPAVYKRRLAGLPGLSHVTVEVERCPDHAPRSRAA